MEHELARIFQKPNDYKLCNKCNRLNWYENDCCIECGSDDFKECGDGVEKWVNDEYEYWISTEGYSEEEADNVFVEI